MNTQTSSQEIKVEEKEEEVTREVLQEQEDASHPYAFHVSGPRNLTNLNWRDLISSSWWVPFSCSALIRFEFGINLAFCLVGLLVFWTHLDKFCNLAWKVCNLVFGSDGKMYA